ncbi:flagellin, partial [uncultured Desulfovibrio sp.]|uniref:flagellin n=1 Tax=uncultured Desulfovibrio sp. TaxID=167968 RepID=UPI002607E3CB
YDSTQRLMIDSEFQQMASEIDRIAKATDFNGVKLLDGSLSGPHDGTGRGSADGLSSTGALKVHFGTANDSAEDYYYVEIGDCTLAGLGLREGGAGGGGGGGGYGGVPILSDVLQNGVQGGGASGIVSFAIIPAGTTNFSFILRDNGQNDDIEIFTRSGQHLAGTTLADWNVFIMPPRPIEPNDFISETNGFLPGATYTNTVNGTGTNINFVDSNTLTTFTINGMTISYTGSDPKNVQRDEYERITIDYVTEDLILMIPGMGSFRGTANWTAMPTAGGGGVVTPGDPNGDIISIKTQELAQQALNRLDSAIVRKDQVRAHLGAMQNRLENTVSNINIQAENLLAAESRISDVDVATEMTTFVRNQILTQSATSMLAQANAFPHMLLELIGA